MDIPGITAGIVIVLLVIAGGCSVLSPMPKSTARPGISGENSVIETPTLPDQYTAHDLQADSLNPAHPPSGSARGEKPILRSAAQVAINGTGLTGSGTKNETNALIVSYLTQEQNYTNQTVLNAETQFWNDIGRMVQKKMDYKNSTTIDYALKTVRPFDAGIYSVNQTCDLWDYTMPPNWTPFIDTNATTWDEDVNYASTTISNGLKGDCDDFAVVLASANIVLGGKSRVVYAVNPTKSTEAHMYAEAGYDNSSFVPIIQARYNLTNTTPIYYHPGNWLNLDWFNYPATATNPGGKFYNDGGTIWVIYQHGNWEKLRQNGTAWDVILQGNA